MTAYCFDDAVTRYGSWVENKSMERDKDGKLRYRLEDLLTPVEQRKRKSLPLRMLFGRG